LTTEKYTPAVTTIATIWTTIWDVFFTTKTEAACTTFSGLYPHAC
jgi:hypothetical protein